MNSPSRPVTQLDKSDVLDGLFASWDNIDSLVGDLPDPQWTRPTSLPGWDVHDVVAHVVGTESMLQGAGTPEADVDVSTLKHVRNDIGVLNERWVRNFRELTHAELLDAFRDDDGAAARGVVCDGRGAVERAHGDTGRPRQLRPVHAGASIRLLDARTRHPRRAGANRRAMSTSTAHDSRLALDEMAASMGFVVGKLGGAPDGSRVRIELTGPLARTINVAVDGRAKLVDDFGGDDPTATITLDGLLFARLAGGRMTGWTMTRSRYGGDEAVGRRIVEHLNYVI